MDELIKRMILSIADTFTSEGDYIDFRETREASAAVEDYVWDNLKDPYELDKLIGMSELAFQNQGFYYGFKMAMDMLDSSDFKEFVMVQTALADTREG